jgi:hypothetical protein
MSVEHPNDPESEHLALAWQVDAVCLRFEAAWQAGQRPGIEAYLADSQEPLRSPYSGPRKLDHPLSY